MSQAAPAAPSPHRKNLANAGKPKVRTVPLTVVPELDPALEAQIDNEIWGHDNGRWCFTGCATFRPDLYRHYRRSGKSFETMKKLHDLCHVGDD